MNSLSVSEVHVGSSVYSTISSTNNSENSVIDQTSIINEFLFHKSGALAPLFLDKSSEDFEVEFAR